MAKRSARFFGKRIRQLKFSNTDRDQSSVVGKKEETAVWEKAQRKDGPLHTRAGH
jgi:hypothetical protein